MAYGDFATKVGDEIGIVRYNRSYGGIVFWRIGRVTKINGHGHIFVTVDNTELRFDRRGQAYKDEWGPQLIYPEQLRARVREEERRKEQSSLAREIQEVIREGSTYSGRFFASPERVAKLKGLVEALEQVVDEVSV